MTEDSLSAHVRGLFCEEVEGAGMGEGEVIEVFFSLECGPILRFKSGGKEIGSVSTPLPPGGVYPYVFLQSGSVRVVFDDGEMGVFEKGSLPYVTYSDNEFVQFQPIIPASSLI